MVDETFKEAKKLGYTVGELGWVRDDERVRNRTSAATGAVRSKIMYRLYEKDAVMRDTRP